MMSGIQSFIVALSLMGVLFTEVQLKSIQRKQSKDLGIKCSFYFTKGGRQHVNCKMNEKSKLLPNDIKMDVESSHSGQGLISLMNINLKNLEFVEEVGRESETFASEELSNIKKKPPAGYELIPGVGYYKFYTENIATYQDAMKICQKDGTHLAILNSKEEAMALRDLYAKYPSVQRYAYIGFNDLKREGTFVTVFGQPLESTGYADWESGEPNNYDSNEDCGSISRNGRLNDLHCDMLGPWPFICEH